MPFARVSGTKMPQKRRPPQPSRNALRAAWRMLLALTCFVAVGCGGRSSSTSPAPAVNIERAISPQPPRVGPATITLSLTDAKANTITAAHIELEADMSHPGMSPAFGDAKAVAPGRYQGQIAFTMAGDWVILLHITLADGQKLERQFDVKGVRAS
jgi:hypothetical protein